MLERFTLQARRVLTRAAEIARHRGHESIGTEHLLLGLLSEPDGRAALALRSLGLDLDMARREVEDGLERSELDRLTDVPAPVAHRSPVQAENEGLLADGGLETGWRSRPIALAALGAGVLARRAFEGASRSPVEIQTLVYLALLAERDRVDVGRGEEAGALRPALACDQLELERSIRKLLDAGLVVEPAEEDGERLAITDAGIREVQEWLGRIAFLFAGWPPDHPEVDDLTS